MAGTKSGAKKKSSQQHDAGELARVQKRTTAAWKEDAEPLFKHASDLCKNSPRLDQLAGLYLLLRRMPDALKTAKANDKDKNKTKKLEGKFKTLLKQQVLQASNTLRTQQAAAAADGQRPSLVLAWCVAQGFTQLYDMAEDEEQRDNIQGQAWAILRGFTSSFSDVESWLQQWADPVLEYPAAELDDAAKMSSEQLTVTLGSQVLQRVSAVQLRLHKGGDAIAMFKALQPKVDAISKEVASKEVASREAAIKEVQAAASKAQIQQQMERRASPTPNNQQQGGKRGKDADKLADAKRGKAGDDKAAQELQQHRDMVKAAQNTAAEVVKFLSEATLGPKGATKQQHLEALQGKVVITLESVKSALASIISAKGVQAGKGGKDKAAEAKTDPLDAAVGTITQLLKLQFGPVQTADQVVQQLQQAVESGSWLVFCEGGDDEQRSSSGAISSSSKGPNYFTSLTAFQEYVETHQLAAKPAAELLNSWGLHCHQVGPGLLDAYRADFDGLLRDEAAQALMASSKRDKGVANGYTVGDNPLLEAFSKECPLKRYLYHVSRTISVQTSEPVLQAPIPGLALETMTGEAGLAAAAGFALLQLQRGVMVVSPEDLSTAPDWLIKAYQMLKMLLPLNNFAVGPEQLDFVLFYYFQELGEQASRDLSHILDPDLYAQATASASRQGASSSDSSEPTFSDGLVEDSVTMLAMLHEAHALVDSPVRLALQLYSHKVAGCSLPLPHKHTSPLRREELLKALNGFERQAQLDVRSFLLQVLYSHYARLQRYTAFLEAIINKRWKRRYVPVEQLGKSKELVVSQDFYAQACMSAAVPYELNAPCCHKHTVMRELAEADGRSFSKYMVDNPTEYTCDVTSATPDDRAKKVNRYLLQPARVLQAMQEQELHVGTTKGLHALTMELLLGSEYDDPVPPKKHDPGPRSCWDVCRLYLLLASQLAIHRQQLYELVHAHEQRLAAGWWRNEDFSDYSINKAERALLQQRVAGLAYCYNVWGKWFDQGKQQLRDKVEELSKKTAKEGGDKGSKGGKDVKDTQSQRDQKAALDNLHGELEKLNLSSSHVADMERHLLKQMDGNAAHAEALALSVTDADAGMVKAMELLMRELVNPRPAPQANQEGSLRQALLLSRLMLFELDVTITAYVNLAHTVSLTSMWRLRQPAAAVSLTRHALGLRLKNLLHEQQMEALLLEDEQERATAAAKAGPSKAGSKKKKKKGPAQQQPKKQIRATADSDEEASDQEAAEAAAAPAAEDSEAEEADAQRNGEPDVASLIDPRYLTQEDCEPAAHSSSSSSRAKAAAAAAAEEAASSRPSSDGTQLRAGVKPDAAAAAEHRQLPPRKAQQSSQQPQQGKASSSSTSSRVEDNGLPYMVKAEGPNGLTVYMKERGGPTCWTCGDTGHLGNECTTPYCEQCDKYGHEIGLCREACRQCGRVHPGSMCAPLCRQCEFWGHTAKFCFDTKCKLCHRWGHVSEDCRYCRRYCQQDHHPSILCCSKCKRLGHTAAKCSAKECPHCGKWDTGCVPGYCKDKEAAASFSSSSSKAGQQQQQQGGRRGPKGSAAAAPGAPVVPLPSNVKLGPAQQQRVTTEKREEFFGKLFAVESCGDFAASVVGDEEKIVVLMRVPQEVMDLWLQQPDAVQYLEGMLDHAAKTRQDGGKRDIRQQQEQEQAGSRAPAGQRQQQRPEQQRPIVRPSELSPEVAAEFVAALGPDAAQLPPDWRSRTWRDIESCFHRRTADHTVRPAKRKAVDKMLAAAGTAEVQPRSSSSGAPPPTSQWQPADQQQQQQRGSEPSGPRDSRGSYGYGDGQSSGDEDEPVQVAARSDRPPQQQQQQQQGPPPGGLQAQWQQQGGADGPAAAAAGGSGKLHAVLNQKLKQQVPAAGAAAPQPGLLAPQHMAPGASNSYSTPHAQLEQPQQPQGLLPHQADAFSQAEARIHSEPFQSWMLWHKLGAFKAVGEFLPPGEVQFELTKALHADPGRVTNISELSQLLLAQLCQAKERHAPPVLMEGLMKLGKWVAETQGSPPAHLAEQQQQQQPPGPHSAAPPAAPMAMLPPHLRHPGVQQQPAATPGLPPHLYGRPQLQQQQQQAPPVPMNVQMPAAAAAGSDSDDDDDTLFALVGLEQQPQATRQQPSAGDSAATTWADITGQDDSTSADFPPLEPQADAAEDADLQQALSASRAQQYSTVPGVSAAGLANQAGEYNCFLNVVVQCLWSCKQFTQQVRQMAPYEIEHPVVGALLRLFAQMEAAETGWKPGQHRAVINPSELRLALANHTPFQCQEMNDANELLDTIYECFKQAQHPGKEQGSRGVTVDGVFGLLLTEKVVCQHCGKETHKVPLHYEHLVVVNSASLNLAALSQEGAGMDRLLFFLSAQEHKYCDKDEGGCGEPNPRFRELVIGPQVLTLQLVWDQQVSGADIRETLGHVQEDLDITAMYDVMQVAATTFRLSSAVAYYGQHYMAFVFNTKLNTWLMFDDASVSAVGSWQDVINKCAAGRIQPGVLFYQLVDIAALPDRPAAPLAAAAAPHHPAVAVHTGNSSSSAGGAYGHPSSPSRHHAAAASHAFAQPPVASHSAPPAVAAAPSALSARSTWGAASGQPRAAAQQPPPAAAAAAAAAPPLSGGAAGEPWGTTPEHGWAADSGPSPAESAQWAAPTGGSSGSYSSMSGPPSTGATGAAGRVSSSSGDAWGTTAGAGGSSSSSSHYSSRPQPLATGPGAAAAAGNWAPPVGVASAALREVRGAHPREAAGATSTGPRAAGSGVGPRYVGGPASSGPMERSGSGGAAAAVRGGRTGRGGAAGGRGAGSDADWQNVNSRGRGRGGDDWEEVGPRDARMHGRGGRGTRP